MNTPVSPLDFSAPDHDFHKLNPGQQAGIVEVFQFLMSDEKEFSISGPAGAGKTHLMKFIMKHTLKEYKDACKLLGLKWIDYEVALAATTNKAAEVLAAATGFPASTIHSFMSLKVKDNYKTGKSEIIKGKEWKVHTKTIIFIDEGSMIDTVLHQHILMGTDSTCKIIYLGDHCQMAPVFEKISPIYETPKGFTVLTQAMRNAGQPALMNLCTQLRHTVETLEFYQIEEVPGVIDYVSGDSAYQFIVDTFKVEDPSARILTYSNARAQEYNKHVREVRDQPDLFIAGETLVNNSALTVLAGEGTRLISIETEIVLDHVDPTIVRVQADRKDPGSCFDTYQAMFHEKGSNQLATVMIPVDQEDVNELTKHYKVGYVEVAFGLRVRTPLLQQVVMGNRRTPFEAQSEGRTAGNACGQSYGLLNNRAGVEFMKGVRVSPYALTIRPSVHIHDAQYLMIRDDIQELLYVNEHLVRAVQWQEDPLIAHDMVKIGGTLPVFYPNWACDLEIPNGATVDMIDQLALEHHTKYCGG
jgi:hypothetical protein